MRRVVLCAGLFLLLSAGEWVRAQGLVSGAVEGVTLDVHGKAVPGVRLTLEGDEGQRDRIAVSDTEGWFRFSEVPPGTFSLHAHLSGMADIEMPEIVVQLGAARDVHLVMRVTEVPETVMVRSRDAGLSALEESPVNATISPRELFALPLDGRRFQSFALLTPLVNVSDRVSDTDPEAVGAGVGELNSDTARLTMRGLDPSQNSYASDGAPEVRAFDGEALGGSLLPFNMPLEAIQEFQVRVNGAGSPLGRDAGGSVNAVTRRGEQDLHGSAFFLLRSSGVGAADPFAVATHYNGGAPTEEPVKPRDRRIQYGGSLGKTLPGFGGSLSGFLAVEGQRRSFPGVASPNNPAFFHLTPVQTALLANRGVSGAAIAKGLSFIDSLGGEVPRQANALSLLPRLDWDAGGRNTIALDYDRVRFDSPAGLRTETVIPRSRDGFGSLNTNLDAVTARWTWAATHGLLNELRMQGSHDEVLITESTPLPDEPLTGPKGSVPQVTIDLGDAAAGGAFTFGSSSLVAKRRLPDERRATLYDGVTWNSAIHTLSLGGELSRVTTTVQTGLAENGAYQYASGAVNGRSGGLADFLTDFTFSSMAYPNGGCPSIYASTHLFCFQHFTQSFGSGSSVKFQTVESSLFVQDAWRPTRKLRFQAGVRYERFQLPPAQHPNAALDAIFAPVASSGALPGSLGSLLPYGSAAYGLGRSTVLRLGYGAPDG